MARSAPLVDVVRGGFVEGRHHGSVVALAADGSVDWSLGAADEPMLPRSALKPLQALTMLRAGLRLDSGVLLAAATASHGGEPFHLEAVRRILAGAGLTEDDLQTPPDLPSDPVERDAWVRAGQAPCSLAMTCSGKHAAMLATCVANSWPTSTYLSPDHPLQLAVRSTVEELTDVPVSAVLVDGCGAPLLSTSLVGLARAFGRLAAATTGAEHQVAQAIRSFPEMVSGSRRDEAALLRAVPGAIAKSGAEAVYAVGLPDGRAVALKIEDGAERARPVAMAAALARLGVGDLPGADPDSLAGTGRAVLLGGDRPVGELRAAF